MHTGATQVSRCMCLCLFMCVSTVHAPVSRSVSVYSIHYIGSIKDYHCRRPRQPISFYTCCKVGVNRPCATWGNAEVGFAVKYETTEAGCQEKHTKTSLIKGRGIRVIQKRKVFIVQRLSRLCSPIRVGRVLKMPVLHSTDSEQWALRIRNPWLCDTPPMWAKWLSHWHD